MDSFQVQDRLSWEGPLSKGRGSIPHHQEMDSISQGGVGIGETLIIL